MFESVRSGWSTHKKLMFLKAAAAVPAVEDLLPKRLKNTLTSYENNTITELAGSAFRGCSNLTSVKLYSVQTIGTFAFDGCSGITAIALPSAVSNCSLRGMANITAVDLGPDCASIMTAAFSANNNMNVLILRRSAAITELVSTNTFGSKFASGGTGGTIYIPKALYDHLGDGTSLDYKAATNWATIDGYGTITWAKIEGSIYETQYADGTTIPTT